jgi:hypothetical protein
MQSEAELAHEFHSGRLAPHTHIGCKSGIDDVFYAVFLRDVVRFLLREGDVILRCHSDIGVLGIDVIRVVAVVP